MDINHVRVLDPNRSCIIRAKIDIDSQAQDGRHPRCWEAAIDQTRLWYPPVRGGGW